MSVKTRARDAIRKVGLEAPARRVLEVRDPVRRRDRIDNERLRLLLAFTLQVDSACIDIGSNHGSALADMVELAPEGKHMAFEPIPELAQDLRRRFPRVDVVQGALADARGTTRFSHVVNEDGLSGLKDRDLAAGHSIRHFDVDVMRLDDVVPAELVPRLVKIDVEGAERQVLEGALGTLRRHRPVLWFEHGHVQASFYGTTSNDVWDLLADVGYRIFDSDGSGPYSREGFGALAGVPIWNFVAH